MGWTNGSRCRGCGRGNGHSLTCPEWDRSMAKFPVKEEVSKDTVKRVARVLDRRQRLR